jgi:exodeoxyribonuclease VII small subunit
VIVTKEMKFEDCLQRLEQIVEELEKGDIPLDRALALFEEGVKLSNSCRDQLDSAEGKIEVLLKQNGKMQAEPFLSEKPSKKS